MQRGHGEDIVFGTTLSGRQAPLAGIATMVGLLINTLPLRVRLHPQIQINAFLQRIHDHHAHLQAHGFERLATVQRDSAIPAGHRLFDTVLVIENYPAAPSAQTGGVRMTAID